MRLVALALCILEVGWLFTLDRDRKSRPSSALWLPVFWVAIAGSRMVSLWLGLAPSMDTADKYLDGSPIDRIIFAALMVAALAVLFGRGQRVVAILRGNWPILLFFSYCALSVVWSDYSGVAFKRWIKALGDLLMVLIVLTDRDPSAAIKRLVTRVGFLLLPLSVVLIKYFPALGRNFSVMGMPMSTGVTTQKNQLGMICLLLGLGSLWRFFEVYREPKGSHRKRQLLAHGTILLTVLWLFAMSNSMTSLTCFLLAGSLMWATKLRAIIRRPGRVHLLVVAAVAVPLLVLFLHVGDEALEAMGRSATLTGRTDIWKLVLKVPGNRLIGTGFESFWLGDRLESIWGDTPRARLNEAHNGYLEVLLNLGWIGVALLGVLLVTGYRNAMAALRRDPDTGGLKLAYFLVAVIFSFTEAGFRMMTPVWIFFLWATIAVPGASASAPIRARRVAAPNKAGSQAALSLEQA